MADPALEIRTGRGSKEPLYFGAAGRPLFGFYHPAQEGFRSVGVVLCSPIGTDQARSARTYRRLAERLSSAGFACLRFDPFGTGDSGGDGDSPELLRCWLDDIGLAASELRARSGAGAVALVGLRMGGTLALLYGASHGPVDSLVAWNPCVSGENFLSEATKLHRTYLRIEPQLASAPTTGLDGQEALGMFFSKPLATTLCQIDALQLARRPARRTLLIDGGNFSQRDALLARLTDLQAVPELRAHPGHKFLTTVSHSALVPEEIIDSITGWLSEVHPLGEPARAAEELPSSRGPMSEIPILFGRERRLFGILTPADPDRARADRPSIVIANAGCVNRCGPHRISVRMARRWAQLGFDALRVDLAGIGDSPPTPGVAENLVYPPSGLDDLEQAVSAVGRKRAIITGLCSGGDYAFQMGIRSPGITEAWLLNPRTFCVLDLAAVEAAEGGAPPATQVAEVPRQLRSMVERGVETLLVVSRSDPGVAYVDSHAPEEMERLRTWNGFHRFDLQGADHTFTPVAIQKRVSDLLTDHLLARY